MAFIYRLMLIASCVVLAGTYAVIALRFPWLFYVAVIFLGARMWRSMRRGKSGWSHGTARTAGMIDLGRRGMLGSRGLIMGRVGSAYMPSIGQALLMLIDPRVRNTLACHAALSVFFRGLWGAGRMIRVNDAVHLLTCAPSGAGKSVSVLVPNLLSYPGSCVVTDPKGELALLTMDHRCERMKHRCLVFDPFGILKDEGIRSASMNPLDFIDATSPKFLSQCKDLANLLVVRTGEEKEPHWNDSAELILTSMIAFVCACEADKKLRTLTTVRRLVSSPVKFAQAIKTMQQVQGFWNVVSDHGRMCQWFVDRELGGVMTTVARHSEWMDDPQVAECLSASTFDPRMLKAGRITVYFVLPQDKLATFSALMRTWIGCTLRVTTQGGASERTPVLFLLDEAGHLGHMQILQDAVTVMRGYGIRLWFFFQSLSQVNEIYGKHAPVILDNLATQQFFGINSFDTAEAISKWIGEQTISIRTDNGGSGTSHPTGSGPQGPQPGNRSSNTGWSVSAHGRRLFKPEEILVLPEDTALIHHRNSPVIVGRLLKYFNAPEFRNGGDGRQGGLGVPSILAAAAVVLLAVGMTVVADSVCLPKAAWPEFQAGMFRRFDSQKPQQYVSPVIYRRLPQERQFNGN